MAMSQVPPQQTTTTADAATQTISHANSPSRLERASNTAPTVSSGLEGVAEWAIRSFQNFSAIYILIALIILFGVWMPTTFLTATTLRTLLAQQAVTAMLSVGLVVALAAGVFDLSIAGTLGLSAIVVTKLMVSAGMVPSLAIIVALGAGVLIGAINALLIVVFRIDSFIATLAMQSVLAAMVLAVSGNEPAVGVPNSFSVLGSAAPLWVPLPVWYLVSVALAAWYVLEHTAMGRRIYATGGGREAARTRWSQREPSCGGFIADRIHCGSVFRDRCDCTPRRRFSRNWPVISAACIRSRLPWRDTDPQRPL